MKRLNNGQMIVTGGRASKMGYGWFGGDPVFQRCDIPEEKVAWISISTEHYNGKSMGYISVCTITGWFYIDAPWSISIDHCKNTGHIWGDWGDVRFSFTPESGFSKCIYELENYKKTGRLSPSTSRFCNQMY